jgi:tRNA(Ile)-lysidine synthase
MGDYKVLRPLITVTKEEIIDYNKKNNIKYVEDPSNKKDVYTRNRYRKYILPFFKKEDKNVHQKFLKFSETLLQYNNFIDREMRNVINEVYKQNILNIEEFSQLDNLIQQKIIYYILEHVYQDDLMLIYDKHAELLFQLIHSSKPNSYIYLPNGIKAIKSYKNLTFVKDLDADKVEYEIELINYINLPNGKNIEIVNEAEGTGNDIIRLSSEEIKAPLHVRTRNIGDKMEVKGLLGRKKVKDIFIDEKISAPEREVWPIVIDSTGKILWIPGLKKSKYDKEKNEKYDIILKYY